MSHYLREFPDYDSILPILDGFFDNSWHNDTCPSLINTNWDLVLWCEYADLKLRENSKRFILYHQDVKEPLNDVLILESDSLDEIKEAIAIWVKLL
jgi:hypothetical protein